MSRFPAITLGITLLAIGLCSVAAAKDGNRTSSEMLWHWKLAFVRDNNIWVSNGDGTDQRLIIENGCSPAWSPDKSRIAFVRDNNIWVAETDGSKQQPVTVQWKKNKPKESCFPDVDISISWHPKNGSLTFSHPEAFKVEPLDEAAGMIRPANATGGVILGSSIFDVRLNGTEPGRVIVRYDLFEDGTSFFLTNHANPAWSHSGKKLAFTRNGDIWVAEMKNGAGGEPPIGWEVKRLAAVASYDEPTYRASRSNLGATRLSWHPNGRLLAYGYDRLQGSGFNEIHLLDTKRGRDAVIIKDALHPCFSPDGKFIVYWNGQCGKEISTCIWALSLDGKTRMKLVTNGKTPVW